jgi:hypothetical protein
LYVFVPGEGEQIYTGNNIDEELAKSFFTGHAGALSRSVRGETLLVNASVHFGQPFLALLFPWNNTGTGGVVFS